MLAKLSKGKISIVRPNTQIANKKKFKHLNDYKTYFRQTLTFFGTIENQIPDKNFETNRIRTRQNSRIKSLSARFWELIRKYEFHVIERQKFSQTGSKRTL